MAQSGHHELSNFDNSKLFDLVFLGWYCECYGVNHSKRIIPRWSQILGHHGGVCFVKFDEKTTFNAQTVFTWLLLFQFQLYLKNVGL